MKILSNWPVRQKIVSLISLCLFLQFLISYSLWFDPDRVYPLIPAIEGYFLVFSNTIQFILLVILMAGLALFTLGYFKKYIFIPFAIILIIFVFQDINRLQVWVFQLSLFLGIMILSQKGKNQTWMNALQLGMIGIYWWSGIQKLNIYFVEDIFPWMLQPIGLEEFAVQHPALAILIAVFEASIGLGLLFVKSRRIAAFFAICFHLCILIVLGPLGHSWNPVVWPWNVCMIGLVYYLFFINRQSIFNNFQKKMHEFPALMTAILLFIVLPGLNFSGYWDEQISFKMYSGHSPEGVIYFKGTQKECFHKEHYKKLLHFSYSSQTNRIILDEWAFAELNVAPYKSRYRIIQAAKKLCECLEKTDIAGLEILEVERWNKEADDFLKIPCEDLRDRTYKSLIEYFK